MPPTLCRVGGKVNGTQEEFRSLWSFTVDTGANLQMIGNALGHKSQAVTSIYARLSMVP
jgi:hypothetical protein